MKSFTLLIIACILAVIIASEENDSGVDKKGRFGKFVSDGSDFVLGTNDGNTKRGMGRITQIANCLIPSFKQHQERKKYEEILANELSKNKLFRDGWNNAKMNLFKKDGLEKNEFLAVFTYTNKTLPVYLEFNKQTRELGPGHKDYNFTAMYYFLSAAIHHISGITYPKPFKVYRGVKHSVTLQVNEQFHFDSFASTSTDRTIAEAFLPPKGGTLFIIESYQGGKIEKFSAFPHEKEVLITPCENFKVSMVNKNVQNGRQEIYLESLGMNG